MIGQNNYFGFGFYKTQLKTALYLKGITQDGIQ